MKHNLTVDAYSKKEIVVSDGKTSRVFRGRYSSQLEPLAKLQWERAEIREQIEATQTIREKYPLLERHNLIEAQIRSAAKDLGLHPQHPLAH